jgi:hypothetical protein
MARRVASTTLAGDGGADRAVWLGDSVRCNDARVHRNRADRQTPGLADTAVFSKPPATPDGFAARHRFFSQTISMDDVYFVGVDPAIR